MVARLAHAPLSGTPALRIAVLLVCSSFVGVTSYLALSEAVSRKSDDRGLFLSVEDWKKRSPGELAAAHDAAVKALAAEPLDAAAVIALSRIAEARGDQETSDRLKLAAGELRPRSVSTQSEALAVLLKRRDFAPLMHRVDGLLRAQPQRSETLFDILANLAAEPEARRELARVLAENPPWRRPLLIHVLNKGAPQLAHDILSDVRELGGGVAAAETALVIQSHLRAGAIDNAYYVWLDTLSPAELKSVSRVYDGAFNHPVRSLTFDWTLKPDEGYSYRIFPRNTASMDKTLQIDFLGFTGGFSHLSQMLRLVPGRYRLSGETRSENLEAPQGLAFRVYCLTPTGERVLDQTASLPQSSQWIAFEKTLTIPEVECPIQSLRLESLSAAEARSPLRGQFAIDNISIQPLKPLAQ